MLCLKFGRQLLFWCYFLLIPHIGQFETDPEKVLTQEGATQLENRP